MANARCPFTSKTETLKIHGSPFWWVSRAGKAEDNVKEEPTPAASQTPVLSRSNTISRMFTKDIVAEPEPERPIVARAATLPFWPTRKNSMGISDDGPERPLPRKAKSEGAVLSQMQTSKALPSLPTSGDSESAGSSTIVCSSFFVLAISTVRAPAWLLNAATALDFLQNEHPKVMSTLSAILIVAGTLPTLPVIGAGAGGAILASSTAHAVGAIAVGVGSWLKTQQEMHDAKK
jgi:hypothetical protein